MTDSDTEGENKTHSAGKDCTGVSSLTTKCNKLQSISKITELIFG